MENVRYDLLQACKILFFFQDGKQNHVSFPEFQQNGTAKQFSHGGYILMFKKHYLFSLFLFQLHYYFIQLLLYTFLASSNFPTVTWHYLSQHYHQYRNLLHPVFPSATVHHIHWFKLYSKHFCILCSRLHKRGSQRR